MKGIPWCVFSGIPTKNDLLAVIIANLYCHNRNQDTRKSPWTYFNHYWTNLNISEKMTCRTSRVFFGGDWFNSLKNYSNVERTSLVLITLKIKSKVKGHRKTWLQIRSNIFPFFPHFREVRLGTIPFLYQSMRWPPTYHLSLGWSS